MSNLQSGTLIPPNNIRRPSDLSRNGSYQSSNHPSTDSLLDKRRFMRGAMASKESFASNFALSADPSTWGTNMDPEKDDHLHNPSSSRDRINENDRNIFTARGLVNVGCLILLVVAILFLFMGFPIITFVRNPNAFHFGSFNVHVNATGQVPTQFGNFALIDPDTPKSALTRKSYKDDSTLQLVFSDEFNRDNRTFYPGDDPYWEAVDLHYWATHNEEWYDPKQITTKDGYLKITLSKVDNPGPDVNHGLNFTGGMLQSWNKFCFTGGLIEASVRLPGPNNVQGLWPAVWTMGNLGRAGYGATTDGTWPYSYDSCDVGTLRNQTYPGNLEPVAAVKTGEPKLDGQLSLLPGQRLSRCTCPGESHPGPVHADGTYVGRSAPEIDVFEAQMKGQTLRTKSGTVSQSGQWAPFDPYWKALHNDTNYILADEEASYINSFAGSRYQQATSVVSDTNQNCYEDSGTQCFTVYGFEYKPGFDDAYITWINDDKVAWTFLQPGVGADTVTQIGSRPIPQEPMYILINVGQSKSFTPVIDYDHIPYPVTMDVDYIRVYQHPDQINIGCDPPDFPTAAYINTYAEAYNNPNLTVWGEKLGVDDVPFHQPTPKNNMTSPCT